MTAISLADAPFAPAPALSRVRPRARTSPFAAEPRFATAGIVILLSLFVTLFAMAIDARLFQGDNVWVKPVKFQLSLGLYLMTLAFFAGWLPAGMTGRRAYRAYAILVVLAILAELAWIGGAAMAGVASHFNRSSPTMGALYGVMGVLAVLLTSASLVYGIAIWRNRDTGLAPALKLGVALGLVLTFALTVPIAGTLSSQSGHFVGTHLTGAALPVFGWSREVGDLRAAHFLATHAMHVLPVAGLAASAALPERRAILAVWIAASAYLALVLGSFAGALAGLPLIPTF